MNQQALDPAVFEEISELMEDALGDFIETYLGNSPKLIQQIADGLSAADIEAVCHSAHQLKGGSGSIGAMRLFELAQQIEKTARSGTIEGVDALLSDLTAEYQHVEAALKQYI